MSSRTKTAFMLSLIALAGAGCQSGAPKTTADAPPSPGAETTSEASLGTLALTDSRPLTSDSVTLTVGGLSCPLCANNIENKLGGMKGVQSVAVNLGTGKVTVGLWGKDKPSPVALAKAVKDSGFTPTDIQVP